uniref:Aminotran_1_2 domain-containing protein n=1 Tax=Panagrellus redivivus TaxID=6233 RepID=A0A7E4VU61_PANRE
MGYVRLSCADNVLTRDIVLQKFRSIDWSNFYDDQLLFYTRPGGLLETRQIFADLITEFTLGGHNLKNPINPDHLAVVSGTTMILDLLGQVLFDEDDVLIAHSPFYHRFWNDFSDRGLVDIRDVPTFRPGSTDVVLDLQLYKDVYHKAVGEGRKVKAILLVNPSNPDGGYFGLDEIKPIVDWAVKEHNLFVVLDEIYDLSVYDPLEGNPFESAIRLFDNDPSLDRDKLIWMSGVSKNFSLPGLRTAVMYTPNLKVLNATKRFLMYQGPNATTEFIIREIIGDKTWVRDAFLPEAWQRLKKARDNTIAFLQKLKKVSGKDLRWIKPRAGFFIMIDFSEFLPAKTFAEEKNLQTKFVENNVLIVRGHSLSMNIPGWFRIVFSCRHWEEIEEGLRRMSTALGYHVD